MRRSIQLLAALILCGSLSVAPAQEPSVVIQRDIRLFTVVSALNAAGFDVELASQYHPVRQEIREQVGSLDADLLSRLRSFYIAQRGEDSDEAQLAKYISLALNLSAPPRMVLERGDEFLPADAREIRGVVPLLNEFFEEGRLNRLWSVLEDSYEAELDRLAAPLRSVILGSDVYLKIPVGATGGRQLIIALELTAPVNSVNIRNYPEGLYMVLGYQTSDASRDVRHAYLHLVLDALVSSRGGDLAKVQSLLELTEGVEGVLSEYQGDEQIMAGESLIRAVELRMDRVAGPEAEMAVERMYRQGLLLAPYFYEALALYEQGDYGIREYFQEMVTSLSVDAEVERFDARFHSIAIPLDAGPRAEVPVAPDPVDPVLLRAEDLFNAGRYEEASDEFRRVIGEFDPDNGPALYGLALISSREQDPAAAKDFFTRAARSPTILPSMQVWSHIYLGRIYDLECDRTQAVEQYSLALEVGDDTRGAVAAARDGLAQAFGEGCGLP